MEFKDEKAIFLQIADYFMENLLRGTWADGDRIMSVRETAAELEVNANTVLRTYNHMQDQGIIFNKRGIGYFFDDQAKQKVITIKRKDFEENSLPQLFQYMDLLSISITELEEKYKTYKINQDENR